MDRSNVVAALLAGASLLPFACPAAAADQTGNKTVDQVVVTAPRQASTALVEQAAAPNLVNVQSAETIEKFPDVNAAEALGRIPGVSLSIDTGEGRFVTIRGIDSNLDGATFGGVSLLNSYPGGTYFSATGRAVEFDTVPIGAVDRIEVTKSVRPDQDAEGIGGTVELTPRSPRAFTKPFLDLEVGASYENLRGDLSSPRDTATVGARFGFGDHGLVLNSDGEAPRTGFVSNPTPFSFVITQFQHNDRRSIDDFEEGYGSDNPDGNGNVIDNLKPYDTAEFRRYNYFRRRFGVGGEFDFDPNPNHHYFLRADEAGYTENVNRQRLLYAGDEYDGSGNVLLAKGPVCAAGDPGPCTYNDPAHAGGFLAPAMGAAATLRDQQETHRNELYAIGGQDNFGGPVLDYQGAYTRATYHKPYDRNWTFNNGNTYNLRYNNVADPNFPTFNVTNPTGLLDPTQYALAAFANSQEHDLDQEWSGQGNLKVPVHLFSDEDFFRVGGKVRYREKEVIPTSQSYKVNSADTLANFLGGGPYTYYDGRYPIGYRPGGVALEQFFLSNPSAFVAKSTKSRDLGGYYRDNEDIKAGYGELSTTVSGVNVLAGVRVENTDATYRGYVQGVDANGNPITPYLAATKQSYTDVFPSVQLRYEFMPRLVARLAWSTAISRPGFSQITATSKVDVGGATASTGNPNLKPTYSNNIDLSLAYYLPGDGVASVGLFDKEMSNYIVTRTITTGNYLGIAQIWHLSSYENAPAYARGIEAQYVQKFVWAPMVLRDFGVDANVTYVDSQVDLYSGVKALLPGTSRWTGNAALFYEAHGLQLRAAAEYVGANLFGVGGSQTTNAYEDKRIQVDFTSSYAINPMATVFFNVKNLNNEPLRFYEGYAARPVQREFYLQTFEFGVRLHLQ